MDEEDEEDELFFFHFFFYGLGWVRLVGGSILALICFLLTRYLPPLCFVFSLLLFSGEDCCCTLLIDLIERLARPIFP